MPNPFIQRAFKSSLSPLILMTAHMRHVASFPFQRGRNRHRRRSCRNFQRAHDSSITRLRLKRSSLIYISIVYSNENTWRLNYSRTVITHLHSHQSFPHLSPHCFPLHSHCCCLLHSLHHLPQGFELSLQQKGEDCLKCFLIFLP